MSTRIGTQTWQVQAGGLRPDSGSIWFDGRDITALSTAARARMGMGRTFQISSLAMEYSVLQNAVLGAVGRRGDVFRFFRPVMRDRALLEVAEQALDQVGLLECRHIAKRLNIDYISA